MPNAPSAKSPIRLVNERRSPRRRTLLSGKLVLGEGDAVDCTIRDISETGAKVRVPSLGRIPARAFLIVRRTAMAYEARVSWTKALDIGLTFVNAYSLEPQVPAELHYLLRIWATFRPQLADTQ